MAGRAVRLEAHAGREVDRSSGHPPVRSVPVETLSHHPLNPRRHPERSVRAVKASVARFGLVEPLTSWRGMVVAGNARLDALRAAGAREALVIDVSEWPEERAIAFMVAHNRSAEMSRWDWPALQAEIAAMSEDLRSASGFSPDEIVPLLAASWSSERVAQGMVRVRTTREQAAVVRAAIEVVRAAEQDAGMSDGRCIELIAADYLAGQ